MLRHVIAPSSGWTKASHTVVRDRRINSNAKILILYVQGLPDSATSRPLGELALKLGMKGTARTSRPRSNWWSTVTSMSGGASARTGCGRRTSCSRTPADASGGEGGLDEAGAGRGALSGCAVSDGR